MQVRAPQLCLTSCQQDLCLHIQWCSNFASSKNCLYMLSSQKSYWCFLYYSLLTSKFCSVLFCIPMDKLLRESTLYQPLSMVCLWMLQLHDWRQITSGVLYCRRTNKQYQWEVTGTSASVLWPVSRFMVVFRNL